MRARPLRAACVVALVGCAPPAAPHNDADTSPDVSPAPAVFAVRAFIPTIDGQRPAVGFAGRVDNNHGLFREVREGREARGSMPKPSRVPLRVAAPPHPSVEPAATTPRKPARRTFTAAEKLRIVRAADACTERGEVEALLRREGVYSSHLAAWRKALRLDGEKGLVERAPGRKATRDDRDARIARLERENAHLEKELRISKGLVALQ